jgi:predicted dehydrogenase
MVHGVVTSGAVVSAHIATVPSATPGFRMEIYGSAGALHVSTPGAVQRDANRLLGAHGRGPLAPMEVPASYTEAPPDTPPGPPTNVAALYRRLAVAVRGGAAAEPGFDIGVKRQRLIDAIARSSEQQQSNGRRGTSAIPTS